MLRESYGWKGLALTLAASTWLASCGDDDENSVPRNNAGTGGTGARGGSGGRSAGGTLGSSGAAGSSGTSGASGTSGSSGSSGAAGTSGSSGTAGSSGSSGTAGSSTGGTTGTGGAGTGGASGADASDAPIDAPPDSDAGDASPADTGDAGPRNVLYATFNGVLVRINPDTAQETEIGPVRNAADAGTTYVDPAMTWSGTNPTTAFMITSYNVAPTLASIDLCTGRANLGPVLSNGASNLVVEGIARHTDGTLYVTNGNPSDPINNPTSPRLGTLSRSNGVITNLPSSVVSAQNDVDAVAFVNGTLYGIDVVTTNNRMGLFTLSLTTGADTDVASAIYASGTVPLRIAYDESRDKAFAWRASDRNLIEINLETAAVTPIGQTHPSTSYGNQPVRAFFSAPAPSCP